MYERKHQCLFCGRVVLFDDATYTVAHEEPLCPEFEKLMENAVAEGLVVLNEQGLLDIRRLN